MLCFTLFFPWPMFSEIAKTSQLISWDHLRRLLHLPAGYWLLFLKKSYFPKWGSLWHHQLLSRNVVFNVWPAVSGRIVSPSSAVYHWAKETLSSLTSIHHGLWTSFCGLMQAKNCPLFVYSVFTMKFWNPSFGWEVAQPPSPESCKIYIFFKHQSPNRCFREQRSYRVFPSFPFLVWRHPRLSDIFFSLSRGDRSLQRDTVNEIKSLPGDA